MEAEQWVTWARKPDERFDKVAERTEVEYGITNRLQLALYANYSPTKIVPSGPALPTGLWTKPASTASQRKPSLLDPDADALGFALYLEPAMGAGERALEGKLLFQKNFLNDRPVFAANVNIEYVWVHDVAAGIWDHETDLELYLGFSYCFAPGWFGGVELLNETAYAGHIGSTLRTPRRIPSISARQSITRRKHGGPRSQSMNNSPEPGIPRMRRGQFHSDCSSKANGCASASDWELTYDAQRADALVGLASSLPFLLHRFAETAGKDLPHEHGGLRARPGDTIYLPSDIWIFSWQAVGR